jgi:hypothetical protein
MFDGRRDLDEGHDRPLMSGIRLHLNGGLQPYTRDLFGFFNTEETNVLRVTRR